MGRARMLGLEFKSAYCKDMRFSAALTPITPASITDRGERAGFWATELMALHELDVKRTQFINPVTSIFLITYRKHGEPVLGFWRAFVEGRGTKDEAGYDAVEGLAQWAPARQAGRMGQRHVAEENPRRGPRRRGGLAEGA